MPGGGAKSEKHVEWSNGLDTALYKNYLNLFLQDKKIVENQSHSVNIASLAKCHIFFRKKTKDNKTQKTVAQRSRIGNMSYSIVKIIHGIGLRLF